MKYPEGAIFQTAKYAVHKNKLIPNWFINVKVWRPQTLKIQSEQISPLPFFVFGKYVNVRYFKNINTTFT